jgi:hypothetical protein
MTPAERLDAIRADRVARGLAPTIQAPAVYSLLAAVLTSPGRDDDDEATARDAIERGEVLPPQEGS